MPGAWSILLFIRGPVKYTAKNKNEKKYTYENILTKANLLSKNLKERSLIFVLADNSTECLTAYVGFFKKGIVQMLLEPKISTNLLEGLIETYKPNYILMPTSRVADLKNFEVLKVVCTCWSIIFSDVVVCWAILLI